MTFSGYSIEEILDDLSCRFLLNVPEEELEQIERICFQVEQAHWFYEDFVREDRPELRTYSLKEFSAIFFKHSPMLGKWANKHEQAYQNFLQYKFRIPVCGAIILNPGLDKFLAVKGYKGGAWSFPRGKINHEESQVQCAIREVMEEIGFDIGPYIIESDYIELKVQNKKIRLYIIPCIHEDTIFVTKTRKEISKIAWHPLSTFAPFKHLAAEGSISNSNKGKYYLVSLFMNKLANWVSNYHKTKKYFTHISERAPDFEPAQNKNIDIKTRKGKITKPKCNTMLNFSFDVNQILNAMRPYLK